MKIPLFKPCWDKKDLSAVTRVIKRGTDWACGPEIELFEKEIAKYVGSKYAVVFNSGTSALHAAMIVLEIGKGDEVIVPSFTFIATANAPLFVGAKPVFADIEIETMGLNPEDVLRRITDRTKAIIPVHYGGTPCRIKELKKIADDYGLFLVEDACEAFGATVDGKKVGTFGEMGILSFCQNKIITTGEGGAVVTDNPELYKKLKLICSHGKSNDNNFINLGYNWRLGSILAALGLSQISKTEEIIKQKRENVDYFNHKLDMISTEQDGCRGVYQLYSLLFRERDKVKKALTKGGVQSRVYFEPIHESLFYKKLGYKINLPVTEEVSKKILTLPMYPDLTRKEMDYIANIIWKATFLKR